MQIQWRSSLLSHDRYSLQDSYIKSNNRILGQERMLNTSSVILIDMEITCLVLEIGPA